MQYNRTIVIIIVIIIALIVTVVLLASDTDTGDFSVRYRGNSRRYENSIKSGINRWSSIGTGGIALTFDTYSENTSTVAKTSGTTIHINESRIRSLSSLERTLTIAHEVGHALGIGVGWPNKFKRFNSQPYLDNDAYPKTAKSYVNNVRPSGQQIPGPPLHNSGLPGSIYVHWSNSDLYGLKKDLMTAFISTSSTVISVVDLTYLDEIGRKVDISQAESLNGTYFNLITSAIIGENEIGNFCGCCDHDHEQK